MESSPTQEGTIKLSLSTRRCPGAQPEDSRIIWKLHFEAFRFCTLLAYHWRSTRVGMFAQATHKWNPALVLVPPDHKMKQPALTEKAVMPRMQQYRFLTRPATWMASLSSDCENDKVQSSAAVTTCNVCKGAKVCPHDVTALDDSCWWRGLIW